MSVRVLRGTISNLRTNRQSASFFFSDSDQSAMGVIAIAAVAAGLGSQAIAVASASTSTNEEADYLEFELDGCDVKGWVWRSPFSEGDEVEVVVERGSGHYVVYALARPSDRTIALYPHCSRGKLAHIKNAVKWWFIGVSGLLAVGCVLFAIIGLIKGVNIFPKLLHNGFEYFALAFYAFFGLMTFSLVKKWMPFVRLSERCFSALGWANPSNVDLVAATKKVRKENDPGELGVMYFRY